MPMKSVNRERTRGIRTTKSSNFTMFPRGKRKRRAVKKSKEISLMGAAAPDRPLITHTQMILQKCPVCRSDRLRRGYQRTSVISKVMFRYNLLCDNCNLEFKGFAVPGTVRSRSKYRSKNGDGSLSGKKRRKN